MEKSHYEARREAATAAFDSMDEEFEGLRLELAQQMEEQDLGWDDLQVGFSLERRFRDLEHVMSNDLRSPYENQALATVAMVAHALGKRVVFSLVDKEEQ